MTGWRFLFNNKTNSKIKLTGPVIIFDFDGTIADAFNATIATMNQVANEYGYSNKVDPEEVKKSSLTTIIKKHNIPFYKVPFFHKRALEITKGKIDTINPIAGIKDALLELKKQGFQLAILTSNCQDNVNRFLKNHDMAFFDVIYSGASIFGKHKVLNNFLKDFQLNTDHVLYVGDELRDIEACQKAHIKIVAVSWGFNNKDLLAQAKPEVLLDQPSELHGAVKKLIA